MTSMEEKLARIGKIIQGGMGAGVSGYPLVRAVSHEDDALGVVSGTALDEIMVRRLQLGNTEVRDALLTFLDSAFAEAIVDEYYIEDGKAPSQNFRAAPFPTFEVDNKDIRIKNPDLEKLIVAANFVEVKLAKEGHDNPVGINYLHKIQWPLLPAMYGAMMAGVDVNLIGAGFPTEVPKALDSLIRGEEARMSMPVVGSREYTMSFDPRRVLSETYELERPLFLGIVGNHLGVKGLHDVDGYIFEEHPAGGHNAPAREKGLTDSGEPRYGPKDEMNFALLEMLLSKNAKSRGLRQPYWFAGSYAGRLNEAIDKGARGVQVGTPFAFAYESGLDPELRRQAIREIASGAEVFTDPRASPSGFPFKVLSLSGTLSDPALYDARERVCNLGYLIDLFVKKDGSIGTRCPADKPRLYTLSGGSEEETYGKKCLCNGLMANIGVGSLGELALITSGSDLTAVRELYETYGIDYTAKHVLDYIGKQ